MSVRSCFQPFLVAHAKMLFFVDDQQAKVLEPDALGQQRMGADDDIHRAASPSRRGSCWHPWRVTNRDQLAAP